MLKQITDLWLGLSAVEQAALCGLLVSGLLYVARHLLPKAFANEDECAKWRRTGVAVLLSLVPILLKSAAEGWQGLAQTLLSWALTYAVAEGAHTVVARSSAAVGATCDAYVAGLYS